MIISWMLYAIGIGAMLVVAGLGAESFLRSARVPVRFVWGTAIALMIGFTIAAPFRSTPVAAPVPRLNLIEVDGASTPIEMAPTMRERVFMTFASSFDAAVAPAGRVLSWASALPRAANVGAGAACAVTGVASLLFLVIVYSRSMRESARWPRLLLFGRAVRIAPETGPAVMGIAPPEIVIPQWVLQRRIEEQELVLEHESEHLRAHDPYLLAFACVGVALMPWNPAVWFMWSRLRLAVEVDCDQRVLRHGVQKPVYGELLVELSAQRPWDSLAMPAFSWGSSHLERRLVAMTPRRIRFKGLRRLMSASVVGFALVAACQSEIPTAAQVEAMDVAAVTQRLQRATDSAVYFVEGKPVSKGEALSVASSEIGSVEVVRGRKVQDVSEVHVSLLPDSIRKVRGMALTATPDSAVVIQGVARLDRSQLADTATLQLAPKVVVVAPDTPVVAERLQGVQIEGAARPDTIFRSTLPRRECTTASSNGTGERVRVRGQSSSMPLSGACSPMIIVDGKIVDNGEGGGLAGMNPETIERIEVVKGTAAMQTYGPKAVNGVIVITRKK